MKPKKRINTKMKPQQNLRLFIVGSLFLILLFWLILSGKTTDQWVFAYCKFNPSNCILEPTEEFLSRGAIPTKYLTLAEYCQKQPIKDIPKGYCKPRKKTQYELAYDYCSNHTNDFDKCRCTTPIPVEPFCYSVSFCDPINKTDCKTLVTCSYLEPGLLCPKARPLSECEKKNSSFKCINPSGDADGNYYCPTENCISKTECEKRTEDWREEPRFDIRCLTNTNIIIPFYNLTYETVLNSIQSYPKCVVDKQYASCIQNNGKKTN